MRIIKTSVEEQIPCTLCGSRIGVLPKDVHFSEQYYFICPVCGVKIAIDEHITPKWAELLKAQFTNQLREIPK